MSVRLCMLARDEAPQITDVAEACGGLYDDYVVLVDSRTTDDTAGAILRELGDAGRIVPFEFRDFADARNQLFLHARPGADYLLLVDPDSPPRGDLPATLSADVYDCEWRMGETTWRLPILVRADADCRYEGACHELLAGSFTLEPAPDLRVNVTPKPVNRDRLEQYLSLLDAERASSPRSAFYYAQTLRDLGYAGDAIEGYLRCAQMPQDRETIYLCLLEAGRLMLALDLELARNLLERARAFRPARLESVYWLAWLANRERRHGEAADLALAGLRMPRSDDRLFIDRHAEREGLGRQLALALGELSAATSTATLTTEEAPHG